MKAHEKEKKKKNPLQSKGDRPLRLGARDEDQPPAHTQPHYAGQTSWARNRSCLIQVVLYERVRWEEAKESSWGGRQGGWRGHILYLNVKPRQATKQGTPIFPVTHHPFAPP